MTLKFKLDENLPDLVRESLGALGLDVHTVADEQLSGASDEVVLRACIAENRVLITLDLDFSDIRAYIHLARIRESGYFVRRSRPSWQ